MFTVTKPSEVPSSATVAEPGLENTQATRQKAAGTIQVFHTHCLCHASYEIVYYLAENVSGT